MIYCDFRSAAAFPGLSRQMEQPFSSRSRKNRLAERNSRYDRASLTNCQGQAEVGDTPARNVGPGDVVTIPPGVAQRIHNSGSGDLVFLAVCTPRFEPACYRDVDKPTR